jgi:glycosyltransferase involved in cell wall biosynthesis
MTTGTPFLRVIDPRGHPLRWVLIRAPLLERAHHVRLGALVAEGCRFAGISSYLGFPGEGHRDELDYGALCEAWFHCFREPDRFLPAGLPRALVSESDFTDPRRLDPSCVAEPVPRQLAADVVYVSARPAWKQAVKNWPLASRCLPLLAEAGLRVLVVDAPPHARSTPGVRVCGRLPWQRLLSVLARARCAFLPYELDASPRILAEALCLGVPVVVNRRILGGWKYVNAFTAEFFDDEHDVVAAVGRLARRPRHPRAWFTAHHGPARAGARVLALLRTLDTDLPTPTHVLLTPEVGADGPAPRGRD